MKVNGYDVTAHYPLYLTTADQQDGWVLEQFGDGKGIMSIVEAGRVTVTFQVPYDWMRPLNRALKTQVDV